MSRLASQIVCVCAYLSNFLPALVPPTEDISDSDIQEYFASISDDEHSEDDSSISDGDQHCIGMCVHCFIQKYDYTVEMKFEYFITSTNHVLGYPMYALGLQFLEPRNCCKKKPT